MTNAAAARPLRPAVLQVGTRGVRLIAIAAPLWALGSLLVDRGFWPLFTDGLCITLMCWFFIDGGRMAVARIVYRAAPARHPEAAHGWPGWRWMGGVIALGTLLGYASGQTLAAWLLGAGSASPSADSAGSRLLPLLLAFAPGIAITWFFYTRERLAHTAALAQSAQRQAAEAQLKLLQAQLEPHMLFNTLANLRVLIAADPPRAQAMLDRLIAFLRATLGASRAEAHSLAAEFERLGDYLALMSVRMGERLSVRFDLPDALRDHPVPPMLLQPLVENAVRHGLEPQPQGGCITVSAAQCDGELLLSVRDTGVGLARPVDLGSTGFGLAQVRERLATLYGARATLTLDPAHDGGVQATVRLPLQPAPDILEPCHRPR